MQKIYPLKTVVETKSEKDAMCEKIKRAIDEFLLSNENTDLDITIEIHKVKLTTGDFITAAKVEATVKI